ncbi:hypothetical protein GCM10017744_091280 [Streptomyces antimycoticus]|uniref:Orn/DAP/Arg decarboxylase 2 N-terminal domain-containing protein n=1 Tax=Streptomyces antimycoticus TaxID=68175 RepID=A0A4D4JU88_9ACTN|nr:hypothetical protein SANT12839_003260 [Streptomyces antimycoticus]
MGVVLPDQIGENVELFRSVYRKHHLSGQIFLAHKANRSSALLRGLVTTEAGVDVASLGELQHALGCGFGPERVMATGPKSPEFLWPAARTGATIGLDSPAELDQLAALVRIQGLPRVRVLLRLSGFEPSGVKVLTRRSRFGIPIGELDAVLKTVGRYDHAVELTGVAYHLDTTSPAEKAVALEGCLMALEECRGRGLAPRAVDIGGGFGVNYLADHAQWERYTTELANAVLGRCPPLTWGGHHYGLRDEDGTLRGALGLYPAYRPVAGERYLDDLLSRPATAFGGRELATLLLEHLYDLYAEPGRRPGLAVRAQPCSRGRPVARHADLTRSRCPENGMDAGPDAECEEKIGKGGRKKDPRDYLHAYPPRRPRPRARQPVWTRCRTASGSHRLRPRRPPAPRAQ